MKYRILVNDTLEDTVDGSHPLTTLAHYVETRMPSEERLSVKGYVIGGVAILRTRNYTIEARAEAVRV